MVVKVDDGCQAGGEIEDIKGFFQGKPGIEIVASHERFTVAAQAQLPRLL